MEKLQDVDFIQGKRTESFITNVNIESGIVEHFFEITKGLETRNYKPFDFFKFILQAHYEAADKIKNYKKQLVALANAESEIARYIFENGLKIDDYAHLFSDINITRTRLNTYATVNEKRND